MANKKQLIKITFETPPIFIVNKDIEKELEKKLKEIKKRTKGVY